VVPRALGDLAAASGWTRLDQGACPNGFASRDGVGDGLNERSGRCGQGWRAIAGRFIGPAVAGAVLAESQPEWRASLGLVARR